MVFNLSQFEPPQIKQPSLTFSFFFFPLVSHFHQPFYIRSIFSNLVPSFNFIANFANPTVTWKEKAFSVTQKTIERTKWNMRVNVTHGGHLVLM